MLQTSLTGNIFTVVGKRQGGMAVTEVDFADEAVKKLVGLICKGDAAAFETLVRQYEQHVSRLMWRFSHDPNTHEDLVHEVFVQVYLSLENFRGNVPFIHWLSAVASRTGLRWWKKRSRDKRFCALPEDLADTRITPEISQPAPRDMTGLLNTMLAELSENDRMVLTLMYYEKKNAKEIAALLGWTHTATRMRISRARRKLQIIARKNGLEWEEHE